jgi:hypothetical protein
MFASQDAMGDVIVLANRTGAALALRFQPVNSPMQQISLGAGEVRPMFVDGRAQVAFAAPGQTKQYQLDANSAYFFGRDSAGRVDMQKIGLGSEAVAATGRPPGGGAARAAPQPILVKIYVDEEEPGLQFTWEARLRRRVEAASAIIERHSRIRLNVVGTGTWNSDNRTNDFIAALAEFEKEVNPLPARLAIGFTSQFTMVRGRVHMAGTRGPMQRHILVREGSPEIGDAERLEFLVHELGHFLGAAHSPEPTSVMRPVLGDNRAGRAGFAIQFDPVNTLIVASIGEEMGRRNVQQFSDLSTDTKRRLQSIYASLARALPEDAAGGHFMRLAEASTNAPLVNNAKRALRGIVIAATANRALLPADSPIEGLPSRRSGDDLTAHLVREAAVVAGTLPADIAPSALLLALAIGLDDSNLLQLQDETRTVAQLVETAEEQRIRLAMLGEPTLLGRRELARRFFAAAFLAGALGPEAAKQAMLDRELAKVESGRFSFALVAADRAGIRWGNDVSRGRFSMKLLTSGFNAATVMPNVDGLSAELPATEFVAKYGSKEDQRLKRQLFNIDFQIAQLPLYRTPSTAPAR